MTSPARLRDFWGFMADFTYHQATGQLFLADQLIGECYSGYENGWNNPEMEAVKDGGPIPRGWWSIGKPFDSETHGPFVLRLTEQVGTNTFGRNGFLIHGDSREHPGQASHGCIVAARPVRERIAAEKDAMLKVI